MLIDMHVHTTRYSKCSRMAAESMAERARTVGLDGIVITEHDVFWSDDEIETFRENYPDLTILRGVEVSASGGIDILVYGLTQMHGMERGMTPQEVVEIAHANGGVAIWAHPLRKNLAPAPDLLEIPFDALECQSLNIDSLELDLHHDVAKRMGTVPCYNSDAHDETTLGAYATDFHVEVSDERTLADAIRARRFTPRIRREWEVPAWDGQVEKLMGRVDKVVQEGVTDPDVIRARVGIVAMSRIEQVLRNRAG